MSFGQNKLSRNKPFFGNGFAFYFWVGNLTATSTAPQKWQYHSFFYTLETHEHIEFFLAKTVDVSSRGWENAGVSEWEGDLLIFQSSTLLSFSLSLLVLLIQASLADKGVGFAVPILWCRIGAPNLDAMREERGGGRRRRIPDGGGKGGEGSRAKNYD